MEKRFEKEIQKGQEFAIFSLVFLAFLKCYFSAKLPKWFGERPGKKSGDPESPEDVEAELEAPPEVDEDEPEDEEVEEEEEEEEEVSIQLF